MIRTTLTIDPPEEYDPQRIVAQLQDAILTRPYFGYYYPNCFTIDVEECNNDKGVTIPNDKEQADASQVSECEHSV